jgi:hypothetical protein
MDYAILGYTFFASLLLTGYIVVLGFGDHVTSRTLAMSVILFVQQNKDEKYYAVSRGAPDL